MKMTISETATSTWNYHLHIIGDKDQALIVLCGRKLGWDVAFPLGSYGVDDGHSKWCKICEQAYHGILGSANKIRGET